MPQAVTERSYFLPRLIPNQSIRILSQFGGRFSDPFQTTFHGVVSSLIYFESSEIHSVEEAFD